MRILEWDSSLIEGRGLRWIRIVIASILIDALPEKLSGRA